MAQKKPEPRPPMVLIPWDGPKVSSLLEAQLSWDDMDYWQIENYDEATGDGNRYWDKEDCQSVGIEMVILKWGPGPGQNTKMRIPKLEE